MTGLPDTNQKNISAPAKRAQNTFGRWSLRAKGYIGRHNFALSVLLTAIVVITGIALGASNNGVVPQFPQAHYHYTREPGNPLSFLSNWDGPDYLSIVHSGYQSLFDANFFPLYPMLIYVVALVVRSDLVSALLIAWVSLAGAIWFYMKIINYLFGVTKQSEMVKALAFFLLFPSGIFLVATYTESLYACLALGAIYYSLQGKWLRVAPLLLLCTATHITGGFVVVLAAMILWEQKVRWRDIAATVCIGCIGLLGYMYYVWRRFDNPFAFIKAQQSIHGWGQHSYLSLITRADPLHVIFIVLLVLSAVYWWPRRKSFAVYSLLFLLIPLAGRQYGGFNRYVLMAFPLQFMLYAYLRDKKQALPCVLALMLVVWTYFTLQYAGGYIGN